MRKIGEFVFGFILSIASWETWENIIISVVIAFLGGFAAIAGKELYLKMFKGKKS